MKWLLVVLMLALPLVAEAQSKGGQTLILLLDKRLKAPVGYTILRDLAGKIIRTTDGKIICVKVS